MWFFPVKPSRCDPKDLHPNKESHLNNCQFGLEISDGEKVDTKTAFRTPFLPVDLKSVIFS